MYFHKPQEKPRRWGSFADIQFAVMKNCEKIYGVDPDSMVLCMPLFLGLPPLDYSGKNNHGTNHGATYKDGNLDFDGSNDLVTVAHDTSLNITGDITISAWIKKAVVDDYGGILAKTNGAVWDYDLIIYETAVDNKLGLYSDAGTPALVKSTDSITDTNWHHVVVTRSGTTVSFYIDGGVSGTPTMSGNFGSNSYDVEIGRDGDWNAKAEFNGIIDEIHISNTARTADQIALFHDRPWALYQPVQKVIYSIAETAPTCVSVSDGLKFSESISEITTAIISTSDEIKFGETIANIITQVVSVSDGIKFSETLPAPTYSGSISGSDGLELGDSTSETAIVPISISDGVKFSEDISSEIIKEESVSDGIEFSDTTTVTIVTATISITDGITFGDTVSVTTTTSIGISDGIELGETIANTINAVNSLSDGLEFSDLAESKDIIITDGIEFGDSSAGEVISTQSVSDGLEFGDTTIKTTLLTISLTDGIKFGDTIPTSEVVVNVLLTDGSKFGATISGAATVNIGILSMDDHWYDDDYFQWFDTNDDQWLPLDRYDPRYGDSIDFNDNTETIIQALKAVTDGISFGETIDLQLICDRLAEDGLQLSDSETEIVNAIISVLDGLVLSDVSINEVISIIWKFITKDNIYYFETEVKNNYFVSKDNTYYFKTKP